MKYNLLLGICLLVFAGCENNRTTLHDEYASSIDSFDAYNDLFYCAINCRKPTDQYIKMMYYWKDSSSKIYNKLYPVVSIPTTTRKKETIKCDCQ